MYDFFKQNFADKSIHPQSKSSWLVNIKLSNILAYHIVRSFIAIA